MGGADENREEPSGSTELEQEVKTVRKANHLQIDLSILRNIHVAGLLVVRVLIMMAGNSCAIVYLLFSTFSLSPSLLLL